MANKHYHQGKFHPKNISKYDGDPTQIIYRSSWELKFFNWCDDNPSIIKWSSEETVVPYRCLTDNKMHRYFVDAKIQVKDRMGNVKTYLIEIKPANQTQPPDPNRKKTARYMQDVLVWGKNTSKWDAAREFCKDRGYEFKIITERDLGIKK